PVARHRDRVGPNPSVRLAFATPPSSFGMARAHSMRLLCIPRPSWTWLFTLTVAAAPCGNCSHAAEPLVRDPVEDLRTALKDENAPNLGELVKALHTLG